MNLENLNLVELNAQEKRETEGGFWWALLDGPKIGWYMDVGFGYGSMDGAQQFYT